MLRYAFSKARAALWAVSQASASSSAGVQLEPRALTSLLGFRGLASQSWAAQAAAAPLASPQQDGAAPAAPPPWTPTRELRKRKVLTKRMQHLLTTLESEREQELAAQLQRPDFGPGDVVELKLSVPENKRRVAAFKGICIARRNRSLRTSFTLRNIYGGAGGIERTFPLYSPHITEMRVVERRRVRRAKLYYLRERSAKEYRI